MATLSIVEFDKSFDLNIDLKGNSHQTFDLNIDLHQPFHLNIDSIKKLESTQLKVCEIKNIVAMFTPM